MAYKAPEFLTLHQDVINMNYTNSVDMWSLGCIVYRMIAGVVPFQAQGHLYDYSCGRYPFPEEPLSNMTVKGAGFVKQLLQAKPKERPSASEALDHPWISGENLQVLKRGPQQQKLTSATKDRQLRGDCLLR